MGRLRWAIVALALGTLLVPMTVFAAGQTVIFGPYASDSTDSGTCGNNWANDTMDRVFKVDTAQNSDGTYNVTEEFKNGTFSTIAGQSPGACDGHPDNGNTVPDGLTGKFQGSFTIVVSNGVYDPSATCSDPCYTATFVAEIFGPGATYDVPTFFVHYNAKSHGQWKNASDDRGGNNGDITS